MTLGEAAKRCKVPVGKLRTMAMAGKCPFIICDLPKGRKQRTYLIYPDILELYLTGQWSKIEEMPENTEPVYVGNYRKE